MNNKEILLKAFRSGQAWNPAYPNLSGLNEAQVKKMTGKESDAQDLIRSFQMSDANYDGIVGQIHGRTPNFDGEIGPATEALAIHRSKPDLACPLPDFAPPPNARFHYDDPGLQKAVESMQRAAAMGSGSWPSCDPDRPGVNSFRVRIETSRIPPVVRAYYDKALKAVVDCYAEIGCALRYLEGATGDCEIAKKFENLAGSVIGWNEFPNPGTCNQTINGRLDTGYAPSDYRYWANLEAHETGHGVGLNHTRGHIMNPSILLVWPLSWRGGPSESTMVRYFGGQPVPTTPGPGPGPEPLPGKLIFRGEFEAVLDGKSLGRFILMPRPEV